MLGYSFEYYFKGCCINQTYYLLKSGKEDFRSGVVEIQSTIENIDGQKKISIFRMMMIIFTLQHQSRQNTTRKIDFYNLCFKQQEYLMFWIEFTMKNNEYNSFILENRILFIYVISSSRTYCHKNEIQFNIIFKNLVNNNHLKCRYGVPINQLSSKIMLKYTNIQEGIFDEDVYFIIYRDIFSGLQCMMEQKFNFINLHNFD
ncbi:unnamed protein product (macronuclear) [Paramecium tetraurelia]|uniref:Uncharacterized protein n=1 Tax=Paramecium tetraurelia TaxID=5888 RepID=A0DEX9_PARTE|nr:uncharacterized protein GSPATT00016422001 [Paramecium tetraurelia]CAK81596.1 unnamed protein product [Paramecium tetraurelia]|eukprot:XP_001448993.1 hypothetical protein (macronuclear) [Paramecium tetraurelia strain d4-2]